MVWCLYTAYAKTVCRNIKFVTHSVIFFATWIIRVTLDFLERVTTSLRCVWTFCTLFHFLIMTFILHKSKMELTRKPLDCRSGIVKKSLHFHIKITEGAKSIWADSTIILTCNWHTSGLQCLWLSKYQKSLQTFDISDILTNIWNL